MRSAAIRRAIGVTLTYIGVFIAFVLVQFGRGGGFSFREGRLSVSASIPRGGGAPESVKIAWPGLAFEISSNSPAILSSSTGGRRNALPRAIAAIDGGVRLGLQGGVEILIKPGTAGAVSGFSMTAKGSADFVSLALSCRIASRSSLGIKGGRYFLESGGSSWEFSQAPRDLGVNGGLVLLEARAGASFSLSLVAPAVTATRASVAARAPEDPALYRAAVAAWTDKLWTGLAGDRWDEDQGTWRDADGSGAFSETALAVWLAEGFGRGQATATLARARVAARLHADSLTWLTVPFLGDTIRKMQQLESQDALERKRLATLLDARDPALFEKDGLVHFLVDRSSPEFARAALTFASELDPAALDRRQALGILACAVEAEGLLTEEENPFPVLTAVADRIVSDVRDSGAGLFLQTAADGSSELRESLRAGVLLGAWGQSRSKPAWLGLGQGLVESVLALADSRGFVPARGIPRSGGLEERSGSIAPERLYPIVAAGPWWPREVSFHRDAAPGVWAWTCAPSLELSSSPGSSVYTASFPAGFEHYISFYGIPPFTNIRLYGIDYRADPRFEGYDASGYYYRPATLALHLKMKHKNEGERIELSF